MTLFNWVDVMPLLMRLIGSPEVCGQLVRQETARVDQVKATSRSGRATPTRIICHRPENQL